MEYEANNLSLYFVDTKTQQLQTLATAECEVEYMFTDKIDVNLLPTNQQQPLEYEVHYKYEVS